MGACLWAPDVQRSWGTSPAHTLGLLPPTPSSQARASPARGVAQALCPDHAPGASGLCHREDSVSLPPSWARSCPWAPYGARLEGGFWPVCCRPASHVQERAVTGLVWLHPPALSDRSLLRGLGRPRTQGP